jgi:hypothetical protein
MAITQRIHQRFARDFALLAGLLSAPLLSLELDDRVTQKIVLPKASLAHPNH